MSAVTVTILVIDDDRLSRWSLTTLLGRAGHRVAEAATGREGLVAIKKSLPNLVLLDIELPDMDGFAVLRAIRDSHPDLPVLMMTADATAETSRKALRLGAQGCLDKPCDPTALYSAVSWTLRTTASSDQPTK